MFDRGSVSSAETPFCSVKNASLSASSLCVPGDSGSNSLSDGLRNREQVVLVVRGQELCYTQEYILTNGGEGEVHLRKRKSRTRF